MKPRSLGDIWEGLDEITKEYLIAIIRADLNKKLHLGSLALMSFDKVDTILKKRIIKHDYNRRAPCHTVHALFRELENAKANHD